jgi:hypothetical protein
VELSGNTIQIILLICAVVVAGSGAAAAVHLAGMRRDLRRALRPSEDERIARLGAQTRANDRLIETPRGRETLVEFFASELHISAFLREAEEEIQKAVSVEDMRLALARLKSEEKARWWNIDSLKRGAKAIGGKLFDKANDFIKPYIGGGGEGES